MEALNLNQNDMLNNNNIKLLKDILTYYYLSYEELDKLRKENNDLVNRIEGEYRFEANYIQDISKSLNNLTIQ